MLAVSIILPIFNVEQYLKECLDSIIKQTLKNIEIICLNDGSTDGCLQILQDYAKIDNRIIIINQKNQGSGIARNNGINIASGEYIAFMDPDDYYYDENSLLNIYEKAKETNVDLCGGNFIIFCDENEGDCGYKKEEREYKETTKFDFKESRVGTLENYRLYSGWFWRFIYKNDFLKNNNIKFPNYKRFQDIPFLAKSLSLSKNIYFLDKIVYCYRINHKVIKYPKEQQKQVLFALRDCFNIYINSGKYEQYSDIFTIFIEMIDVFSSYIENEEIILVNQIYDDLNLDVLNELLFPKKCIKNLKKIIGEIKYKNLLGIGKYFED